MKPFDTNTLGGRIAMARKARQLTQAELAKQAGIKQAYVSQIESGERKGTTTVLRKLAAALDCDIDDLPGR